MFVAGRDESGGVDGCGANRVYVRLHLAGGRPGHPERWWVRRRARSGSAVWQARGASVRNPSICPEALYSHPVPGRVGVSLDVSSAADTIISRTCFADEVLFLNTVHEVRTIVRKQHVV